MKILVLDDDRKILNLMERIFKTDEVYVRDMSLAALYLVFNNEMDVVISDYDLGRENGVTFLKIVKEHNPNIRTILMSGSDIKGLDPNIVDVFIKKPFEVIEIRKAVGGED